MSISTETAQSIITNLLPHHITHTLTPIPNTLDDPRVILHTVRARMQGMGYRDALLCALAHTHVDPDQLYEFLLDYRAQPHIETSVQEMLDVLEGQHVMSLHHRLVITDTSIIDTAPVREGSSDDFYRAFLTVTIHLASQRDTMNSCSLQNIYLFNPLAGVLMQFEVNQTVRTLWIKALG